MENSVVAPFAYYQQPLLISHLLLYIKFALQKSMTLYASKVTTDPPKMQPNEHLQHQQLLAQSQLPSFDNIQEQQHLGPKTATLADRPRSVSLDMECNNESQTKRDAADALLEQFNNRTLKHYKPFKQKKIKKPEPEEYKRPRIKQTDLLNIKAIPTRFRHAKGDKKHSQQVRWGINPTEMQRLKESLLSNSIEAQQDPSEPQRRPRELAYLFSGY